MILRTFLRTAVVLSVLLALLSTAFSTVGAQSIKTDRVLAKAVTAPSNNGLPLSFVANAGQLDPSIHFETRTDNTTLRFGVDGIAFNVPILSTGPDIILACANPNMQAVSTSTLVTYSMLRLIFDDVNSNLELSGVEKLAGAANTLSGSTPLQTDSAYTGVIYRELYPGVDLSFAGLDGKLMATFTLAAGVNPSRISWRFDGANSLYVVATGDLHAYTPDGALLNNFAPAAWQARNGSKTPVNIGYEVTGSNDIHFGTLLTDYDPALPLTITMHLG